MKSILILNGPNLNLLGTREPDIYGDSTLEDIEALCRKRAGEMGIGIEFIQSNHEGELVDAIQSAGEKHHGVALNAAAYTHTSIALLDAVKALDIPVVEVHLSNVFRRESFRKRSFISPVAVGVICGFGIHSYVLAMDALVSTAA